MTNIKAMANAEVSHDSELFLSHAHLFLAKADRILGDERLFYTPLPFKHLFMSGGFTITLGMLVEWWRQNPEHATDREGNLIYQLRGATLGGQHASYAVAKEGSSKKALLPAPFSAVWSTFHSVYKRYASNRDNITPYTFQEVISMLR